MNELADLALHNAFWRDFSALVNAYIKAGAKEYELQESANVFSRDEEAVTRFYVDIQTQDGEIHETILQAFEHPGANRISVQGAKRFERQDGEWYYSD